MTGNIYTGEILGTYQAIVNPDEMISPFIQQLTKLTQNDLNAGVSLLEAYEGLRRMHFFNDAFINPITWGGGDSQELLTQLQAHYPGEASFAWCFGRRWIDVKTLFISLRISKKRGFQGGLSNAINKHGIKFYGQAHDAQDDALNTFNLFVKLIKELDQCELKVS